MKKSKAALFICAFLFAVCGNTASVYGAAYGISESIYGISGNAYGVPENAYAAAENANGAAYGVAENANGEASASDINTDWYDPAAAVYYIDGIAALKGLAALVNGGTDFCGKTAVLTEDIEETVDFTIGAAGRPFSGAFDGGENRARIAAPLFFELRDAEVKNLFLSAQIVDGKNENRGMLANSVYGSVIRDTAVDMRYVNDGNTGNFGGITALAVNSTIENCAVTGAVKKEDGAVGGIAAAAENSSVLNCYNGASIEVSYLRGYAIGGVVGKASGGVISSCTNYAEIRLAPFFGGGADADGAAGAIAGIIEDGVLFEKNRHIKGLAAVGAGGDLAGAEAHDAETMKSAAFLDLLNAEKELFRSDIELDGYTLNGGFPIFKFQTPRPVIVFQKYRNGSVKANGETVVKNFKTAFGARTEFRVEADRYYKISAVEWGGESIALENIYAFTFVTGEIYERTVLAVRFEREMRTAELGGVFASKVYDGTTAAGIADITLGERGLYVINPYFENDDIYVANGFGGGDPIKAVFASPYADAPGQRLILRNVKFGGNAAEYYALPDEFRIFGAEIKKAPLSLSYGGFNENGIFTPGTASSVYGEEITEDKYFGFSVSDAGLMLSGNLYVEIALPDGSFRPLERGEVLPAGLYTLRPNGLQALNYDITFEECALTVEKRRLTADFGYAETEYGAPPVFQFVFSNFAAGEDESVLLSPPVLGERILLAGTHRLCLTGGYADNYEIVNLEGEIKVNKKAANVTIDGGQFKIYGDGEPVLTGQSPDFCYGDAVFFGRLPGENAARYAYAGYAIIGADGGDVTECYETSVLNPDEKFEIRRRELTVTAEDITVVYGAVPSYKFSYFNLAPGDTGSVISALKARVYGENDARNPVDGILSAGNYAIMPYGGVNDNYIISYGGGRLTVEKAALQFAVKNTRIIYGGEISCEYAVSGFKYNQNESVIDFSGMRFIVLDVTDGGRPDAGEYGFYADGLNAENYRFIYGTGILTVEKAPLTVRIKNPVETEYGSAPEFEYGFEGFAEGDGIEGQLEELRADYASTAAFQTAVPYAKARNYSLTFIGNTLKINPKPITITGVSVADKLCDGSADAEIIGAPTLTETVYGDVLRLAGTLKAKFISTVAGVNVPVELSGVRIEGDNAAMYSFTLPRLYGNISVDALEANGVKVKTDGLIAANGALIVNVIGDLSGVKNKIKKSLGNKRVYYAADIFITADGGNSNVGKYYIYIPITDGFNVKNLKAAADGGDGVFKEVETYIENGFIVVESEYLGRVALIKDDNTFAFLALAALLIAACSVIVFLRFGGRKGAVCKAGAGSDSGAKKVNIIGELKAYFAEAKSGRETAAGNNTDAKGGRVIGTGIVNEYGIGADTERGREIIADGLKNSEGIGDAEYEEAIREAVEDGATRVADISARNPERTGDIAEPGFARTDKNLFEPNPERREDIFDENSEENEDIFEESDRENDDIDS
ncbi:MAG: YDG domain-containing protein [Clostridiales bacterium]|jgi:hypothetical protein|nr:YDG domain-containing protein [Clostridiales bacterium]